MSGHGIARVGDADVELGPGEGGVGATTAAHGVETHGGEAVCMVGG